jgi:hypothetical protein
MLFLKIFDSKEDDWEITTDDYKSPIPKDLRWRNWAADEEGMTGEELLGFVNNSLFPRLEIGKNGIHVAEYFTELPPVELLKQKLHLAIVQAKHLLQNKDNEAI